MVSAAQDKWDAFNRKRILPEELRRNQVPPPLFDGSYRWFASSNIIDLWHHRSSDEKKRILDAMWKRRWAMGVYSVSFCQRPGQSRRARRCLIACSGSLMSCAQISTRSLWRTPRWWRR